MKNIKTFEDRLLKDLHEKKYITNDERLKLLKNRIIKKTPLLESVAKLDSPTQTELLELLANICGGKAVEDNDKIKINESHIADEIFSEFRVVLGSMDASCVDIYMFEPIGDQIINKIEIQTRRHINKIVIPKEIYDRVCEDIKLALEFKEINSISSNEVLKEMPEETVAIFFADELLQKALDLKASDIHIEPLKEEFRIRMRVDGVLQEFGRYDNDLFMLLSSRMKLLSALDIAERRDTQDGSLLFKSIKNNIEVETPFRVSVMPTIYGEKVVLRRLSSGDEEVRLADLKMPDIILEQWREVIKRPHGIVLVSGPTGSGKSTTLFAAINEINTSGINIVTVEDPVEFKIPGVSQVQINSHKISFADALRSILRQDPDVIMIGEIRDRETAEVALRASLTGHLVFSTIHTNDAASAVTRLVDMGIEPFLVASSLVGVLAQRLVRVLCPDCKEKRQLSEAEYKKFNIDDEATVYTPKGCRKCHNSGYIGRQGIYEFLVLDEEIKKNINRGKGNARIKEYAIEELDMQTLLKSSKELLIKGITSHEEILRVTSE